MEYKKDRRLIKQILSGPITYLMIFPMIFLDLFIEIYHNISFRLLGLPLIKRSNYIKVDRHKLSYLNLNEKINCTYCGYVNGLLNYSSAIAGKSEEYWCGIKHKKTKKFNEPKHHKEFLRYDDKKEFYKRYG